MQSALRRGRRGQGDGKRVAAQHHQSDEPPDCALAVRVGADELGDVADRCGLGLDSAALGGQ